MRGKRISPPERELRGAKTVNVCSNSIASEPLKALEGQLA